MAAVNGVDFIHTDVWVSMGEPKEVWAERIELLKPYQVNMALMKATGNPARQIHALPAGVPRPRRPRSGRQISRAVRPRTALEVTDEVFESEMNIAFEQAENRLHTIKAMLVATLGD